MTPANRIREAAAQIVADLINQASDLKKKLEKVEAEKAEIELELSAKNHGPKRFNSFEPLIGRDLQCPECWIRREVRAVLTPISSNTSDDWYRCKTCRNEFCVPQ